MLRQLTVSIRGVSPLIMHNGQTADPLNKFSRAMKEISGKRKKTDEDYAEMSRIEWHAGLYVNAEQKLILPAACLEASIYDGAKKSKLGKAFKSAVFIEHDSLLDIGKKYGKAEDLFADDQFKDIRGVRVNQARVMRTRPIFWQWGCEFIVTFDDEQVNLKDVERAIADAGSKSGVGDFRPRYGRFEVVS
jgi:copper chaperone CopZ